MSFSVEKLPNEPIIVVVINDPFDYKHGPSAIFEKVGEEIGNSPGPFYWITDLTGLSLDFKDWITMRAAAYVPSPHSVESGRMCPLYVGSSGLLHWGVALENMRRAKFDLFLIRLFDTFDEALAYARSQLSS